MRIRGKKGEEIVGDVVGCVLVVGESGEGGLRDELVMSRCRMCSLSEAEIQRQVSGG